MATLEKIRNKSVMLIIVIGVALLAFIIGDGISSFGQIFGNSTTVAEVDGDDIDIQEFQKVYNERQEEVENQIKQQEYYAQKELNTPLKDAAYVQQLILDEMISNKLVEDRYGDLGIDVSKTELTHAFAQNPYIQNFIRQNNIPSVEQAYEMIFDPAKYQMTPEQVANARFEWLKQEKATKNELKYQKLMSLTAGCLQANALDIKEMKAANNYATVNLVKLPYSSLKNKDFKVSDEELKTLYGKDKQQFRVKNEIRKVAYITIDVVPSEQDNANAKAIMDTLTTQLRAEQGFNAASEAVNENSYLSVHEQTITLDMAKNENWLVEFLTKANDNDVSETKDMGDNLIFTKLLSTKMEPDSVTYDIVSVKGNEELQNSTLKELNSGKTIKDYAKSKNIKTQENITENLIAYTQNPEGVKMKDKLLSAKENEFFILNSQKEGAAICRVTKKAEPKKMFQIVTVNYLNLPSEKTQQDLLIGLEKYIQKNNTPEAFVKNAIASNYNIVETYLSKDMPQLCKASLADAIKYQSRIGGGTEGVMNSRRALLWAFNNEKGKVSSVFDKDGKFGKIVAVAVQDIISSDFAEMNEKSVKETLSDKIIKNKKAEKLISKLSGKKSMSDYAKLENVVVSDSLNVNFNNDVINLSVNGRGVQEPVLIKAISRAKEGAVSAPIKGEDGVYVFKVVKKGNDKLKVDDKVLASQFKQKYTYMIPSGLKVILRNGVEVKTELEKFYNNNQQ